MERTGGRANTGQNPRYETRTEYYPEDNAGSYYRQPVVRQQGGGNDEPQSSGAHHRIYANSMGSSQHHHGSSAYGSHQDIPRMVPNMTAAGSNSKINSSTTPAHTPSSHRVAERPFESTGIPRFPNFILDTPLPESSASSGTVSSSWSSHHGRSQSAFPSPPLVSPVGSAATFSRRDSSNSASLSAVLSPTISSGSGSRDEGFATRGSYPSEGHYYSAGSVGSAVSPQPSFGSNSSNTLSADVPPRHTGGHHPQLYGMSNPDSGYSNQYDVAHVSERVGAARPGSEGRVYAAPHRQDDYNALPATGEWTNWLNDATPAGTEVATITPGPSATSSSYRASLVNIMNHVELPTSPVAAEVPPSPSDKKKKGKAAKSSKKEQDGSNSGSERKARGIFTPEQRKETSKTRAVGACLRCKSQRIRCVPSPDGPFAPCLTCQQVQRHSKKVLHDLACSRWRLGEMVVYRKGGLNLTNRWKKDEFKDITEWIDNNIFEIEVKIFYTSTQHRYDLCDKGVKLRVRRFYPLPGDVLTRKWIKTTTDEYGNTVTENRYINLPAFALANLAESIESLRDYFFTNAIHALTDATRNCIDVVRDHYQAAAKHYWSLPDGDVEKVFLEKFFMLWFCIRFTTGSAYISGEEKLGCRPVDDPDYPLGDRISIPRMITAQCDYIMVKKFLQPIGREVMLLFEKLFHVGNPDHWFTLYVCTFIFLHEASFSSQDRRRHAVDNWVLDARYTVSDFVTDLQFGSCIILRYWHYYRTMTPLDDGWGIFRKVITPSAQPRQKIESAKGKGKKKVHITEEQCRMIEGCWGDMLKADAHFEKYENRHQYEDPLFFVSQMYVKHWKGRKTYNIEDEQIRRLGLQPSE